MQRESHDLKAWSRYTLWLKIVNDRVADTDSPANKVDYF